jgi:hypothetical protein
VNRVPGIMFLSEGLKMTKSTTATVAKALFGIT